MAIFANQLEEGNLYVFITGEGSGGKIDGKVPKVGVVCDSSRDLRVSIIKYKFDDRTTAMVVNLFIAKFIITYYSTMICHHSLFVVAYFIVVVYPF